MASHPTIDTLRVWLQRDREAFSAFSIRLLELQTARPGDVKPSDRLALISWDRSIISDCNKHLDVMLDIESPSGEERQIMQELNKLVNLGDHMLERKNLVIEELEAKLGKVDMMPIETQGVKDGGASGMQVPVNTNAMGNAEVPVTTEHMVPSTASPSFCGPGKVPDGPSKPLPSIPTNADAHNAPEATPGREEERMEDGQEEDDDDEDDDNDSDPQAIYHLLGIAPTATMPEIKKAIKKQTMLLHPDRNPDDPTASSRFADFMHLCTVFDSEASREEYDRTGQSAQLEDLAKKIRNLAMH